MKAKETTDTYDLSRVGVLAAESKGLNLTSRLQVLIDTRDTVKQESSSWEAYIFTEKIDHIFM